MRYISIGQIYDKLLYVISLHESLMAYKGLSASYDHHAIVEGFLRNNIFSPDIADELRAKLHSAEVVNAVKNAVAEKRGIGLDSYHKLCNTINLPSFIPFIAKKLGVKTSEITVSKNKVIIKSNEFKDSPDIDMGDGIIFRTNLYHSAKDEYAFEATISDVIAFENFGIKRLLESVASAEVEAEAEIEALKMAAAILAQNASKKKADKTAVSAPKPKAVAPKSVPVKASDKTKIDTFLVAIKRQFKTLGLDYGRDGDVKAWALDNAELKTFFEEKFTKKTWKAFSLQDEDGEKSLLLEIKSPDDLAEETKAFSDLVSTYAAWKKSGYKEWKKKSAPASAPTVKAKKAKAHDEEEDVVATPMPTPKATTKKPTKEEMERIARALKKEAKEARRKERELIELARQAEMERVIKAVEAKRLSDIEAEEKRIAAAKAESEAEAERQAAAIERSKLKIASFARMNAAKKIASGLREEQVEARRIADEIETAR